MEDWKYNGRRGSYWKKEEAMLKMFRRTEAYKKAKEGISVIKGYQVMVFDYINDIKFLN